MAISLSLQPTSRMVDRTGAGALLHYGSAVDLPVVPALV